MKKTPEDVNVGDEVTYVDEVRKEFPALVTCLHGCEMTEDGERVGNSKATCINVLHVSGDKKRTDEYGRQIERPSSVSHESDQSAGRYWK